MSNALKLTNCWLQTVGVAPVLESSVQWSRNGWTKLIKVGFLLMIFLQTHAESDGAKPSKWLASIESLCWSKQEKSGIK